MLDFIFAPVLSFFSRRLYGKILTKHIGHGFLYLFYLSFLFVLLSVFLNQFIVAPIYKDFSTWLASSSPELEITAAGLETPVQQPYLIKHPVFGPLFLIDTSKDLNALNSDTSKVPILIGKDHVLIRNPARQETRSYDLGKIMKQVEQSSQPVRITKAVILELLNRLYNILVPIVLSIAFVIFFLWKVVAALFYSLIALLLNLFRKEKLSYGKLFTLTCFAMSPVVIIQWISLFSLFGFKIHIGFLVGTAFTTTYLAYGMFAVSNNKTAS